MTMLPIREGTPVFADQLPRERHHDFERERLECIRNLGLSGSPEPELNAFAQISATILRAEQCLITLVDADVVRVIANSDGNLSEIPREHAFCSLVVETAVPLVVPDLSADARFLDNPFVSTRDGLRFYAGQPVWLHPGGVIGTICALGRSTRQFSDGDHANLERLGLVAASLLMRHKNGLDAERRAVQLTRQTETIEQQARDLVAQSRIIEAAADLAKVGAWEVDLLTNELTWSDGMYRIHGMSPGSRIRYGDHYAMYPEPHRSRLQKIVQRAREKGVPFDAEVPAVTPDGRKRWFRIAGSMQFGSGRPVKWGGMKQDITEHKLLLQRVEKLASTDAVTGLFNRAALMTALGKTRRSQKPTGLLILDLDGFKRVNDIHGHQAGDACLRTVGRRLRQACKTARLIARLGGDEFAVVAGADTSRDDLSSLAQGLIRKLSLPMTINGVKVHLGASVGIAYGADCGAELYRRADLALYAAKEGGRSSWRVFTPSMNEAAEERFRQIENIREALARGEMRVHYQEQVRLEDGAHNGFEALIRWQRPGGNVVGPAAFAAALADTELSSMIGDFVLREVVNQARQWSARGVPFGKIAINLSAAQLMRDGFADDVVRLLREAQLSPAVLELEVTEGVFLDEHAGRVRRALRSLRRAGVSLALDDFGTGYASLSHLGQLQIDVLKIDRSFVARLGRSAKDTAIVQFLVQLTRSLKIEVVAEGIETEAQAEFLRAIGCAVGQGFWFSRPQSADAVVARLLQRQVGVVWA